MKKLKTILVLFAAASSFLASCNSSPTADQFLEDDHNRNDIVLAIVNHQPYMTELMHEMMKNDSVKNRMMENIMNDPGMKEMHMNRMMHMCKDDSNMCEMMMSKTMEMCDADTAKCKMMMGSMQSHPNVMKSMKGMCDMENMQGNRVEKQPHQH